MSTRVAQRLRPSTGGGYGELRLVAVAARMMSGGNREWTHGAVLFRHKKIEIRAFEMRTHNDVAEEPAKPGWVYAEPEIERERAHRIASRCRAIVAVHQEEPGTFPYGFAHVKSVVDSSGRLRLVDGEIGVTCATVIAAIFADEGLPLIVPETWPPADGSDKQARLPVVEYIRRQGADAAHVKRLMAEISAPRIRPEDVVAAAALYPPAQTFDDLVEGAAAVSQKLGFRP